MQYVNGLKADESQLNLGLWEKNQMDFLVEKNLWFQKSAPGHQKRNETWPLMCFYPTQNGW